MSTDAKPLEDVSSFTRREHIAQLLPEGAVGVELGVAEGYFSSTLLSTGRIARLYSIDMWAGDRSHDVAQYKKALRALWPYQDKSTCLKMRFDEAIDLFEDGSLDFVYIDGYAHTGQENGKTIDAWWSKVKVGGIFAGDDYDEQWPLVRSEVDAFASRRKLDLYILKPETVVNKWSASPSWIIRKPAPSPDRARDLLAIAEAADSSSDWRTSYGAYEEALLSGIETGLREINGRKRRAGIKYAEQVRVSGDRTAAKDIVKSLVLEVVNDFPAKSIASSLAGPASFDSFGALMVSHKVGAGWLPRYGATSAASKTFFRLVEVGDVEVDEQEASALVEKVSSELQRAPFGFWCLVHSILFRAGLIRAAYVAKDEAAEKAVDRLEARKSDEASSARAYLQGEFIETKPIPSPAFVSLIEGRSIALVGPAVNSLANGTEIDQFDLVIRTNPIEFDALSAIASSAGSRTDVAYYNGRMLQHRRSEAHDAIRSQSNMKFACFRSGTDAKEAGEIMGHEKVRSYSIPKCIFMGRGYALRHYLSDLMHFKPARLKAFNADFFLSATTHYAGYLDTKLNLPHSFIIHDVRESWLYMRKLLAEGWLEADAILFEILQLDEDSFYRRIRDRLLATKSKEVRK